MDTSAVPQPDHNLGSPGRGATARETFGRAVLHRRSTAPERARCGYIRCSTTRSRLRIFAARGCWTGIVRGSNLPSLLPRGATSAVLIHRRFNGPILFGFSARRVRSHRTSSEAVFHKADTSSRKRGTTAPAGRCGSLIGLSGLCEAPVSRETFGRRALHQRFRAFSRGHVRSGMGRRVNNFGGS